MKKIAIFASMVLLYASSAFAGSAASATLTFGGAAVYGGLANVGATFPLIGKTSTNVGFGWFCDPTSYAIETQHKSGTKAFGTAADATSIFQITVTTVGTPMSPGTWSSNSTTFTGNTNWTTM